MSMTSLRVGIAGYGLSGAVFHAPLVEAVDGLDLAAILTRSPERAARAADAHPGARIVADVDALTDGVDVLVVATPNSSHVEVALAGLRRGLAVVVDKPLATTAADARQPLEPGRRLPPFPNRPWGGGLLPPPRP